MPIKMAKLACALSPKPAQKYSSFYSKGKMGSMVTTPTVSSCLTEVFAKKDTKIWVLLPYWFSTFPLTVQYFDAKLG
jgi:hypothetical protein